MATGPLVPWQVLPVMRFQYWSDPMRISTSSRENPFEESARSNPERCSNLSRQDAMGGEASGSHIEGTANSVRDWVPPSRRITPTYTNLQSCGVSSTDPKVIIDMHCLPSGTNDSFLLHGVGDVWPLTASIKHDSYGMGDLRVSSVERNRLGCLQQNGLVHSNPNGGGRRSRSIRCGLGIQAIGWRFHPWLTFGETTRSRGSFT